MSLRQLVDSNKNSEFYKNNYDNIRFELNHLELHHLDGYLYNLYNNGIKDLPNKNNSNIAYLIGITNEEPTHRITTVGGGFPDVDTDFEQSRRQEVFDYLKEKYGDGFAHIGTVTYTAGKSVWNSAARIHGMPFTAANKVSSMMPDLNCPRLEVLLDENAGIKKLYQNDPEFKVVYDDAINLQDCIASIGVHACGAIIADEPLYNYIPLWDSKGQPVSQYEGAQVEEEGLVKLDILGLKTLSVLNTARRLILERTGEDIDYYTMPVDDAEAYKIMWEGQNVGIFQFEGAGISGFVNACKPRTIHDVAVITSVYRPGPMNIPGLMGRIAGKIRGDIDDGQFMFPKYTHLFKMAHNELVYQESFMALSMEMCGFTEIEADKLRKATAKKSMDLLLSLKDKFVSGAIANGEEKNKVEEFWEGLLEFARYSFNASINVIDNYSEASVLVTVQIMTEVNRKRDFRIMS